MSRACPAPRRSSRWPAAAAAGFSILESGGNAIDAGCAAGIALAVLHPDEVNVAGVAPIMIRTGQGKVVTIAGLGHWPRRFPADLFMREHGGKMQVESREYAGTTVTITLPRRQERAKIPRAA